MYYWLIYAYSYTYLRINNEWSVVDLEIFSNIICNNCGSAMRILDQRKWSYCLHSYLSSRWLIVFFYTWHIGYWVLEGEIRTCDILKLDKMVEWLQFRSHTFWLNGSRMTYCQASYYRLYLRNQRKLI